MAGIYQPDFVPQQPMTVSLQFDPASLAEPIETADLPGYLERSLRLYFMDEISGRWTDTMTSSLTITPVNDLFEVSLPVDRMAEFALVIVEPSGTQTSVTPDEGGRFAFTNAQSLTTGIQFPPDAVDTTVTVSYTEQSEPTQQEQLEALEEVEQFAGRSFRLDVLDGLGRLQPGFVFAEPMSMTIQVDPTTISTTTNLLKRLRVYRFNPTEKLWEDLADDPIVTWHGDVIEIETAASRAAEFAVVLVNIQTPGEGTALVYLPMIQR
ncbi:MAG: hypothetical protein HC837_02635 [Chloroflexaceae bacterium]|nr:hypothetical protein [Chloroflexaceae bacterium]